MRWSIIRLIWRRELRDQLRDRRTVFMIAVLPVLLYPVAGFGVMQLAAGWLTQETIVGVVGRENLPVARHPAGWFALTPPPPGAPLAGIANLTGALALTQGPPPLLEDDGTALAFHRRYALPGGSLLVRDLGVAVPERQVTQAMLDRLDTALLTDRRIDLLLIVPSGLQAELSGDGRTDLFLLSRKKDDSARLMTARVTVVLNRWRQDLKDQRLARIGLPSTFDEPIRAVEPRPEVSAGGDSSDLFGMMTRLFPFILVMWSLAGALYPAVDLCAGEKERGTMETLLISPASREEIVFGKFLTIWVFSAATALLNLVSMALTTWKFGGGQSFGPLALFWSVALLLPLSAFFSALCLSVGAYARSTKEGQYYLLPLFLLTLPLIFLTLAPGVELNAFYSMVPITGVALLLQQLTTAEAIDHGLWLYFVPVLAPMVVYSWLALRWAIGQFNREEVLFREAERLDIGLWLKRLWRDKEALPTAGEALACFGVILGLRWLAFGAGGSLPLLTLTGVTQLAFVATPPLLMAVMLTKRPRLGLGLLRAPWWAWPVAVALAVCVLPPLGALTLAILERFPGLRALLEQNHPLTGALQALARGEAGPTAWAYFVALALLPAVCEELAFRGFILSGLRRGFRPWTAVLLSAFLFALYQMNVFQFLPHFLFGIVLGLLVVRAGSVLPAVLFHLVYNALLIAPAVLPGVGAPLGRLPAGELSLARLALALAGAVIAAAWLYVLWRRGGREVATMSDGPG